MNQPKKPHTKIKDLLRGRQLGFALPIVILIAVIVLAVGGFLVYKNISAPDVEKEEIKPTSTQIKSNSPYITLLFPNGGEVWEIGKTYEIKWELRNVNTTVKEISIAAINEPVIGEVAVEDIVKIAPVTGQDVLRGTYKWQIPNNIEPSNRYNIEISITDQDFWKKIWAEVPDSVSFSDFSDGFISIVNKSVQNWKTYRNKEYGFEARYPPGWKAGVGALPNNFVFGESGWSNTAKVNITVYTESFLDKIYKEEAKERICARVVLSGEEAYRCEGTDFIYLEAEHNGKFYLWSVFGTREPEKFTIFNQILSTFKFIEEDKTVQEKKEGGALIWTKTSNPSALNDKAHGVAVDSTGVYIVGWDSSSGYEQWRIEKRKSR